MNGEERYSVIRFSFMPSYLKTETMLRDSGNEYFTKEVSATALEELKHMSLCSDALFKIVMEKSQKAASYLASTITGRKVEIVRVLTQHEIRNLGHSVIMDALAEESDGGFINFEMQNSMDEDLSKRMRMYESSFDIAFLAKGEKYSSLPSFTSIWLIAGDRYGKGKAVYTSRLKDQDGMVTDWSYERHEVNINYEGEDDMGRMMYNIRCREYEEMHDDPLKEAVGEVKNTEAGHMTFDNYSERIMKKGMEKGLEQGRDDAIGIVLKSGMASAEDVAKNFGLSLSEVYEIAKKSGVNV